MPPLAHPLTQSGAQCGALRHVALGAMRMLGSMALVGLPLAWLSVVMFPPSSSLAEPPMLVPAMVCTLLAASLLTGLRMQRRRPTAHGGFELLAAALAALVLSVLWELRLMAGDTELDLVRLLRGAAQLGALMLPAAWLGSRQLT